MTNHRTAALKALGYIPVADSEMRHSALAGEATAHAVLALVEEVAGLRREQRVANILMIMRDRVLDWPVHSQADDILADYINDLTAGSGE